MSKKTLSDYMTGISFLSVPEMFMILSFAIKLAYFFGIMLGAKEHPFLYAAGVFLSIPVAVVVFNSTTNAQYLSKPHLTVKFFMVTDILLWMLAFGLYDDSIMAIKYTTIILLAVIVGVCGKINAKMLIARTQANKQRDSLQLDYNSLQQDYKKLQLDYNSLQLDLSNISNEFEKLNQQDEQSKELIATLQEIEEEYNQARTCKKCGTQKDTVNQARNCKCKKK